MSSVNNVTNTTNSGSESQNSGSTASNSNQQKTGTTSDTNGSKALDMEEALHNALMLGWSIIELRSRIQVVAYKDDLTAVSGESSLRRASVWRALFSRIAGLQAEAFPKGTTDGTLYQPPS